MTPKMLTRQATATLVAAALALTLAACSSGEEPDADGQPAAEAGADSGETADAIAETAGSDGADIQAARAGLATYLETNRPSTPQESTNIPGCPVIDRAVFEAALAEAGYPDSVLAGWATEIEWGEYEDIGEDVMGVACGGDTDGDPHDSDFGVASGVLAVDLAGGGAAADLFPGVVPAPAAASLGGETYSMCDGADFCVSAWHRDGFVVGAVLNTEGADEATTRALLEATLPDMLETLGTL